MPDRRVSSLPALEALLDEALDASPSGRAALVARVRLEHPALGDELAALLGSERELDARRFLLETPAGDGGSAPRSPLAGHTLGAYTLLRPLGQGGMGSVWLARRSDGRYDAEVAVKLLNLALLDQIGAERFRREGNALARLTHPNIARLIDAGVVDTGTYAGQPFLVLERVDGIRIDRYCDDQRLDPAARIALFQQVLAAVSHAHTNLIVHRDLKPSNILVTADGAVKLLDFGIAKLLESGTDAAERTELTERGGLPFTPEYAAPEQVAGDPVTTATDVYSLGVLLYVLLAGRHPTGEGSRSAAEHLQGTMETEPPRLSAAVVGGDMRGAPVDRLRRIYRGDLDNILAKALKKQPGERYPTVEAFAEDLRRHAAHQPVVARPDSWRYRTSKFIRRQRTTVVVSAIFLLTLVAGLAGTLTQAARARQAAIMAEDERDFARQQVAKLAAMNDLNSFLLSEASPSGEPFTVAVLMAKAESVVQRQQGAARLELLINLGRQYYLQEEIARSRRLLEQAYTLAGGSSEPADRAHAACTLAATVAREGDSDRAEALILEGLDRLPDHPRYALDRIRCLLSGSDVANARGDMAVSVQRVEAAERLLGTTPLAEPSVAFDVTSFAGLAYQTAGRYDDAARAFASARRHAVELGRDRTRSAGTLYNNWALMLGIAGQPVAAESLFRQAIGIERADTTLAALSPTLLLNYGRTLHELDRHAEAVQYVDGAYAAAVQGGDDYVATIAMRVRATIAAELGDHARAERLLDGVATRLAGYPPGHGAFIHLLHARSRAALRSGALETAARTADSAVALSRVVPGANQFLGMMLLQRGEVALARGRPGDAAGDALETLEATRRLVGELPSVHAARASELLGRSYTGLGDVADAERAFAVAAREFALTLGGDHPRTLAARSAEPAP